MHFKYPTIFCSKISKTQTPFSLLDVLLHDISPLNSRKHNHLGSCASRLWSYLAAAAPLHAMSRGKHTCAAGDMANFVGPNPTSCKLNFQRWGRCLNAKLIFLRTKCKEVLFQNIPPTKTPSNN